VATAIAPEAFNIFDTRGFSRKVAKAQSQMYFGGASVPARRASLGFERRAEKLVPPFNRPLAIGRWQFNMRA
jgi:hypothetical protein